MICKRLHPLRAKGNSKSGEISIRQGLEVGVALNNQ